MVERFVRARALTGLLVVAIGALGVGGLFVLAGNREWAEVIWAFVTVLGIGPGLYWVWSALRRRQVGVDIVAVLALVGALAVGEYLAGAIITVMLATGRVLEAAASTRARRDLHALVDRAPRRVNRRVGVDLEEVGAEEVRPGDLLLIRPGACHHRCCRQHLRRGGAPRRGGTGCQLAVRAHGGSVRGMVPRRERRARRGGVGDQR